MAQPDNWGTDNSVDVTVSGPKAKPEYGRGATFLDPMKENPEIHDRGTIQAVFQGMFYEAERYRLTFEPDWIINYQQYHGEVEDPGRAEWQSQIHVPMSAQAVNTSASRVTSVLFGTEEWFDTRAASRNRDDLDELAKKLVLWQFDKARAQDPINQSIKDALICGTGIVKIHVRNEVEYGVDTRWKRNKPQEFMGEEVDMGGSWQFVDTVTGKKRMRFEPIVPTDFWLDPSGQNRYYIQRIKRTLSEIWALAKPQYGDDGKTVIRPAIYDPEVVAMLSSGARDQRLDNQAAIIRHERIHSLGEKTVDVYELWGDLIDPANGVTLYKNIFATFVNRQYCIRMPQRNPFLHRTPPYIVVRGQLLPHQIYGYGLLGQTLKLQFEMDRVLRTMIDKIHLSVSMVEADTSAARNPEQFQGDHFRIAPGKVIQKKGGIDPARRIFAPVEGWLPPNQWEIEVYRILQNCFQMLTPNEFATGQRNSDVRKTKEEVQAQVSAAQQQFNEAAQYIEQTSLSPMVNMVYQLMLQFEEDFDDPELLALVADDPPQQQMLLQLKGMTPEERWRMMRVDTDFKVTGVTKDITRQQNLQNMQAFLQMIGNDPTLAMWLDKANILRQIMGDLNIRKNLVLPMAEAQIQAMQEMQMRMLQGAPPPGPEGGQEGVEGVQGAQQMAGQNPHNSRTAMGAEARQAQQQPMR